MPTCKALTRGLEAFQTRAGGNVLAAQEHAALDQEAVAFRHLQQSGRITSLEAEGSRPSRLIDEWSQA